VDKLGLRIQLLIRRVRRFLVSKLAHEIARYLFFVLLAGFYWLIQALNGVHEANIYIPLALTDIPENVVITDSFPNRLEVRIEDKGTSIMRYRYGNHVKTLEIKFEKSQGSDGYIRIPQYKLREILHNEYNISTNLLSISPDTLGYYYTTGQHKRVPIKLRVSFNLDSEHFVRDTLITEDSVTVFAPTHILDKLSAVFTRDDLLTVADDTLNAKLALEVPVGAKLSMSTLDAQFLIDRYTQKKIEVPLEGLSFPSSMALRSFPASAIITCRVGVSDYASVSSEDFLVGVQYATLKASEKDTYQISVFKYPSSVKVLSISPDRADFLIENYELIDK